MNVFVLCTGRCGSTTFARACLHITNLSSAHESRTGLVGEERLCYPINHIEIDNRLSWFLGRLETAYGDKAVYVHLRRDSIKTARSFLHRYDFGIIRAFREGVLVNLPSSANPLDVCLDYCHTVDTNIELFLRTKSKQMIFDLENAKESFSVFWKMIGAEGDLKAALSEWDCEYNSSKSLDSVPRNASLRLGHIARFCKRFGFGPLS